MSWMTEHGSEYAVPSELFALGLDDVSWHNDTCPCFSFETQRGDLAKVFVEHPDPACRETYGSKRFLVTVERSWITNVQPIRCNAMETDDLDKVIEFIKKTMD